MEKIKVQSMTNWLLKKGCKLWEKGNDKRIYVHKVFKTKYSNAFYKISSDNKTNGFYNMSFNEEQDKIYRQYNKEVREAVSGISRENLDFSEWGK